MAKEATQTKSEKLDKEKSVSGGNDVYTIDATNQSIGRVASEAAHVLLGKHEPTFVKNKVVAPDVIIENASKVTITKKKEKETTYTTYSGYPSGKKHPTVEEVRTKHGYNEVIRRAVKGMLPTNRLRNERMKKLTITE